MEHPHGRVVVVASAGGGIQAAAWTARVLTGLQHELPEFANSIAALSGVSGGAVGTMFLAVPNVRGAPELSQSCIRTPTFRSSPPCGWPQPFPMSLPLRAQYPASQSTTSLTVDTMTTTAFLPYSIGWIRHSSRSTKTSG